MSTADHRTQTRLAYDVVAQEYADRVPGLSAEAALDVAMIDDFVDRCQDASAGPVADVGCGTGMIAVARQTYPHLPFDVGAMEELPMQDAAWEDCSPA